MPTLTSLNAFAADDAASEMVAAKRELILLNHTDTEIPNPRHYVFRDGYVKGLYVDTGDTFSIKTPSFGHIVNQNPSKPERVVTVEKWGPQGVLLNVKDEKVLEVFSANEGNVFFGHTVFTQDGSIQINTEEDYDRTKGFLVLRDTKDLRVMGMLETHGNGTHECRSIDGGKTIMVCNGGMKNRTPNLSWIDLKSGKLMHQVKLDPAKDVRYSHFDVSYDGWICVSGISDPASKKKSFELVVFISPQGKVMSPKIPPPVAAKMTFEGLSIAFLGKSGLVAVTFSFDNLLLIFDYKTQVLVGAMSLQGPHGVLPIVNAEDDKDIGMIVSMAARKKLITVEKHEGGRPEVKDFNSEFGGNGIHMTRVYV